MSKAMELDDATHKEITRLCEVGNVLMEQEDLEGALAEYIKAWNLIPDPQCDWEASTWVIAAMADCYFFLGDDQEAKRALEYAMTCPEGEGNAFFHLRLGQVLFELSELDAAADELMKAYTVEGKEIFDPEDPKYLAFLANRAEL